jgi:beta-lactam-binding protein with PASTA domain
VASCPQCGYSNHDGVDFCANPACRAYLRSGREVSGPTTAFNPMNPVPPTAGPPRPVQPQSPPGAGGQQKRGVRLSLDPANLAVEPGGEATAKLTVRNLGTRVEEFRLAARGPAAAFASISPPVVSVYPDDEQSAVLRFAPPLGPQVRAGIAPFEVVANSAIHQDVVDVARGSVDVARLERTSAVLRPELSRGRKPTRHRVTVTNGGNDAVGVQVGFQDQDGELSFEPRGDSAVLLPAASVDFPVLVSGQRRIFGRMQRHPFTAVVTPAGSQAPITMSGTRCQTAVLPWWIPTAAVAIIALVIALIAILPDSKVPGVGGLDQAGAVQRLTDAGYRPVVVQQEDPSVPAGMAIKTEPATGQPLKKGEPVQVFISAGPCKGACQVEVPNVEGLAIGEAREKLAAAGFTVERVVAVTNDKPKDQVITSSPGPNTMRPPKSAVVLTVSSGPDPNSNGGKGNEIELPDLNGRLQAEAADVLTNLGLKVKVARQRSNAGERDSVLASKPPAGTKVKPGSEVTLTLASPTERVDLIGLANKAAWSNGSSRLPFPGDPGDDTGFALIWEPNTQAMEDGTTPRALETHPRWVANGIIVGQFTLPQAIIEGDHLLGKIGFRQNAGAGDVTFVVKANNKTLAQERKTYDRSFRDLDVDLSPARGAKTLEISVLAGASAGQDWATWLDLRVEGVAGAR